MVPDITAEKDIAPIICSSGIELGLFQKLSWGGRPQALFCPVGGGCFVDNMSKGWGGGR